MHIYCCTIKQKHEAREKIEDFNDTVREGRILTVQRKLYPSFYFTWQMQVSSKSMI